VLGAQWGEAIPVVQVLALYGAVTALETNTYYVQLALGNVKRFTSLMSLSAVALVVLVSACTWLAGAVGAAWAHLIVAVAFFPLFYNAVMRILGVKLGTLMGALARPAIASAIMYAAVRQTIRIVHPDSLAGEWIFLLAAVLLGAVIYSACIIGLWRAARKPPGAEEFVLSTAASLLRRRPPLIAGGSSTEP
jgi:O-antigen/teichoic acid export membrane protein